MADLQGESGPVFEIIRNVLEDCFATMIYFFSISPQILMFDFKNLHESARSKKLPQNQSDSIWAGSGWGLEFTPLNFLISDLIEVKLNFVAENGFALLKF